ncbi:MAG: NAD(P)H-hydrate dehydratase [Chloroflexi bacterium]|nr:NAD(P)H-hydrate dehydratase [Chloroflexota bacterium]
MKIVTAAQMAAIEQASEKAGVSTDVLMENAGLAVAQGARDLAGAAGVRVLVLVGPGNNGADGLVAARHLRRWGAEVTCFVVAGRPETDLKMDRALEYGVTVIGPSGAAESGELERSLARSALVIDAVLGTGRARPLEGPIKEAMFRLSKVRSAPIPPKLLALDLPTGLNADTGEVDPFGVPCDLTFALGYPKVGLLNFPGAGHAGEMRVLDIGVPPGLSEETSILLELLDRRWVAENLPQRPLDAHKGNFGHVLVVAGSRNYVGAAYLASQAAVRAGAGLTTLATPKSVYPIAAAKATEPIHLPLPEDEEGRVSAQAAQVIQEIGGGSRRYTNIAVGCGLGLSGGTVEFVEDLLFGRSRSREASGLSELVELPALVDADGLNNLAQITGWPERGRDLMVLTPHPGEMATLTGLSAEEIQKDRVAVAREYAAKWDVCLVLKGANTVIGEPGGMVRVAPFANPGMSSGGTGDVLSGVIAGLMAQGLAPTVAACCGVYLHGEAGRETVSRLGSTGVAASDLLPEIPAAVKRLREV